VWSIFALYSFKILTMFCNDMKFQFKTGGKKIGVTKVHQKFCYIYRSLSFIVMWLILAILVRFKIVLYCVSGLKGGPEPLGLLPLNQNDSGKSSHLSPHTAKIPDYHMWSPPFRNLASASFIGSNFHYFQEYYTMYWMKKKDISVLFYKTSL
jgi:hypothetical protein